MSRICTKRHEVQDVREDASLMWWFLVGVVVGWAACWYGTKFLLYRIMNRDAPLTAHVIQGLNHDALMTFKRVVDAEVERRRWVG